MTNTDRILKYLHKFYFSNTNIYFSVQTHICIKGNKVYTFRENSSWLCNYYVQ